MQNSSLARNITSDDLDRFQQVVAKVLGTPDPAFNLPDDRRWMAEILGHKSQHSDRLKRGLANTLAIMGARGESLRTTGDISLSSCASACVRNLLDTDDWKVWASLPLTLLAEAAPDEFLTAVDRGLSGEQPTLFELFRDEKQDIFGSSPHVELLWALERLAWSEDHLNRAVMSFGKLAQLDPGGKLLNRPMRSLRAIFLPWLPHTRASLDRRLDAIDSLRRRTSDIAWSLMNALLPQFRSYQDSIARPQWRDWAPDEDLQVTGIEYTEATHQVVGRMLEDVGTNGTRWSDLVEAMPQLPREDFDGVVTKLENLDREAMRPHDSALLSKALRSLISNHRSHPDAKWSLPKAVVDRFVPLLARFEPEEPFHRFGWLFGSRVTLPEGRRGNLQEHQRTIVSRQCDAVKILYEQDELNWVPEFVKTLEQPNILGAAMARSTIADRIDDALLREYLHPENEQCRRFIAGFIGQRVDLAGLEWAQQQLATLGREWSTEQSVAFCVSLPFVSTTWDIVEELGSVAVKMYWKSVFPMYVDASNLENAARKLLEYDRPYVAADLLQHHVYDKNISKTLVIETLEQLVDSTPDENDKRLLAALDISEFLAFISDSVDVEEDRIAGLEWDFLPMLGRHQYSPKLLHLKLSNDPEFFAHVVGLIYHSKDEEPHELSEDEQARLRRADRLLKSWRWRPLPGMPEDGGIDVEVAREWVLRARTFLRSDGRLAIGDHMMGQVLSCVPNGDDGVWPHPFLRDLIEELESIDFERGIFSGVLNSQGITIRSLKEGGARERKDTKKYEGWARTISGQWGRTAIMLRGLRDHYRACAKDEDQRAELREDLSS